MTLAELRRAAELLPPGASVTLPREALLDALSEQAPDSPAITSGAMQEPDEWLTAEEAAKILNLYTCKEGEEKKPNARWVYDHADQLGVRRLSRRCVRFSRRAVERQKPLRRAS